MRFPSAFSELSFKLRRLRTTPARKPRTECCCQPVALAIASMVAPAGDRSIAMTCDCLEPDFPCSGLRSFWLCCAVLVAAMTAVVATVRFLTDFDIGILHSVCGGSAAAPPKPRLLVAGDWNQAFVDELCAFPNAACFFAVP